LAQAYLRSSWAVQQASPAGRLQELVTGFAMAGTNLIGAFAAGTVAACSVGAMLALAIGVDPLGSIVAVLAVGALGSFLRPLRRRLQVAARRSADDSMRLATTANEVAGLGMVVHVFDVRTQVEHRVGEVLAQGRRSSRRLNLARGLVPAIYSGLAYLVLVGAVSLASASSTTKLTSLGAVMLVMLRSLAYGQQLQVAYSTAHSNLPQVRDVFAEIDKYEAQAFVDHGDPVHTVCPLALDDVSFHYIDGQPVLAGITATVNAGEMIGVVGPSGSGKSTLVQLLLGLREPVSGRVLADGRDIRSLRHADWARKVTFVPQSPALISGTIAENIRFYREGLADDVVERAAKMAGLHDEIVAFPDGYGHQVGDKGGNLSGGQQQRLCIARALVGDPEVLILDEPTSALDARSEALIRDTLEGLRGHMTIVVIAHRLSTIDQCDRIMVIQHGSIAAFDTPEALKATSNFYAEAVRLSGLA
jgi:ABC-type multidrug transport system fused ATPase/permease subunit